VAHPEQFEFIHRVLKTNAQKHFGWGVLSASKKLKVLDVGCYDINGSCRAFFNIPRVEEYIGCDIIEGKGVDVVCPGHELTYADGYFDTIISCECFEHDMHVEETINNIVRMLKPGGCFVFTCASTGRPEHGTNRCRPIDAPGVIMNEDKAWGDYYRNLDEKDIREMIPVDDIFSTYSFQINKEAHDIYFVGVKKDA